MVRYILFLAVLFLGGITAALAQQKPPDSAVKLLSAPPFEISAEDEAAGIDGTMKIAADINKNGDVALAIAYIGPEWPCSLDFDPRVNSVMRAAEKIVKTYKFSPAIKDGVPVESRVSISMTIGEAARKKKLKENKDTEKSGGSVKHVQGGVLNGRALSLTKPIYPLDARMANVSGKVEVEILIDEDGKVISAQASNGPPLLQFAARSAACSSKFAPTLLNGTPVKVSGVITYNFNK